MKLKEKNKGEKKFTTVEVILLVLISLITGVISGWIIKNKNVINDDFDNDKYLKEFVENYKYIINNYYEEVDKQELVNGAISGMTEALGDPYSNYFNEEQSDNFSMTLEGKYEGLGIQIIKDSDTGYMIITSVFDNSPASEAGLKVGDKITSADSKDAKEMSVNEFSSFVRKNDSEEVKLNIIRENESIDIVVKKSSVTLSSISSKYIDVSDKKVGYIYIEIFANNTYEQFKEALTELENKKIDYLIIDVRGNTGGHLSTVDNILDLFLNSKQIMYQIKQGDNIKSIYGTGSGSKKYEIILLGDEDSASASEVLIAGIKENLNSKLFGKKTYGKGTVQELVNLTDNIQYKITTKKWLTPKGNWVNDSEGIEPDFEIDMDEKYYETRNDEDDSQLKSVLDYIKNR